MPEEVKVQAVIPIKDARVPLEVVEDIAAYYGIDQAETVRRLTELDPAEMARAWEAARPSTPAEIRAFYAASDHYIWETTTWNYGPGYDVQWQALRDLEQLFPPTRFPRVLDYGCGVGSAAFYLADRGYTVTAADVPGRTLDFVRDRAARHGRKVQLVEIRQDLPDFPAESFDVVVCLDVLEHVPNPEEVLAGLARALRVGGAAVLRVTFERDELLPFHLSDNWERFGRTHNWWLYVNALGLDGAGADLIYRRVSPWRVALRQARFRLWRATGVFFMRVPR